MSVKAATDFINVLNRDEKEWAKVYKVIHNAAIERAEVSKRERNAIGEVAKKMNLEFSLEELYEVLETDITPVLREAYSEWKGPGILAIGDVADSQLIGQVAGDPGPGAVATKRGKKAPWRASW